MELSDTGDGLHVLILCREEPHQDWMAFASWYSVQKMLPDAVVALSCERCPADRPLFNWVNKLRVRSFAGRSNKEGRVREGLSRLGRPLIVLESHVLMVREIDPWLDILRTNKLVISPGVWFVNEWGGPPEEMPLCCDAGEEKISTFVSYLDGWGNFVTSSWINKYVPPFPHRFGRPGMTSNEVRIEKMWSKLWPVYQAAR